MMPVVSVRHLGAVASACSLAIHAMTTIAHKVSPNPETNLSKRIKGGKRFWPAKWQGG
jgi:hypothetical protein